MAHVSAGSTHLTPIVCAKHASRLNPPTTRSELAESAAGLDIRHRARRGAAVTGWRQKETTLALVGEGRRHVRTGVEGCDEIARLAADVDAIVTRLDGEERAAARPRCGCLARPAHPDHLAAVAGRRHRRRDCRCRDAARVRRADLGDTTTTCLWARSSQSWLILSTTLRHHRRTHDDQINSW
jgi:hypothetical protein